MSLLPYFDRVLVIYLLRFSRFKEGGKKRALRSSLVLFYLMFSLFFQKRKDVMYCVLVVNSTLDTAYVSRLTPSGQLSLISPIATRFIIPHMSSSCQHVN